MRSTKRPSSRRVVFQPRTWQGMHRGAMRIVEAVAPTLGPTPRFVALSPEHAGREPDLCDNGGEIARRILQIKGRGEDVGAMLIRDLLWRLQNQVGDGTATAAVIFGAVYTEGVRYLTAGGNSRRLQTHLDTGIEVMLDQLSAMTRTLSGKEKLAQLAESISYDPELSRYMGEVFDIIGAHGRLEIRKGRSRAIEREYVEGMYWERGLMSRQMIADLDRVRTEYENAHILISDLEIQYPQELLPVLEMALRNDVKSLIIIAGKLSDAAIGFLLANNKSDDFHVVAVTTPEYGPDTQAAALQDMAALIGGRPFLKAPGDTFGKIQIEDLGQARRVWADLRNFGVVGGKGEPKALRRHIHDLQKAYAHIDDPVPKGKALKRLGKMMGGSATLWVGADTEMAVERRVELAKRTASAMRLAMEEGVLPGAGIALLECRQALRERLAMVEETDERAAYEILIKATEAPIRTIVTNAGYDASDVMADLRFAGPGHGLDVVQEKDRQHRGIGHLRSGRRHQSGPVWRCQNRSTGAHRRCGCPSRPTGTSQSLGPNRTDETLAIMTDNLATQAIIYDLAASPNFSDKPLCFAAGTTGLMRSIDGGKSWSDTLTSLNLVETLPIASVVISPAFAADNTVIAGTSGGILRSGDGGDTWRIVEFPSPPPFVTALVFSPHFERDGVIFAGTLEDGVFVSRDRGYRWNTWNFGLLDLNILALAVSPAFAEDETLYAAVESGIFRSTNGGRAWREIPFDLDHAPVLSLAISPQFAEDGVLLAGTEQQGLFKSEDGGQTWKHLDSEGIAGSVDAILLAPDYPAKPDLLLLNGGELLISNDNAVSWRPWPGANTIEEPLTAVLAPSGLDSPLLAAIMNQGVKII